MKSIVLAYLCTVHWCRLITKTEKKTIINFIHYIVCTQRPPLRNNKNSMKHDRQQINAYINQTYQCLHQPNLVPRNFPDAIMPDDCTLINGQRSLQNIHWRSSKYYIRTSLTPKSMLHHRQNGHDTYTLISRLDSSDILTQSCWHRNSIITTYSTADSPKTSTCDTCKFLSWMTVVCDYTFPRSSYMALVWNRR